MTREHFQALRDYRERVPSELTDLYGDLVAQNVLPNIAAATIVYYAQAWGYGDGPRASQADVAAAFDCSDTAIRSHREQVIPALRAQHQRGDSS